MPIKKDWKYYTGLTLFIYCWIPYLASALILLLLVSFLPYFIMEISLLFGYPRDDAGRWTLFFILIAGDALFMTSLFVLGGDFWNRLKALFKWQGEAAPIYTKAGNPRFNV